MRKTSLLIVALLLFSIAQAQVISNNSKAFTVGFDLFTDIWLSPPSDMKARTINQGFNVFATYNFALSEKSPHTFSIGLGLRTHNLFSDNIIRDIHADTISFTKIDQEYKRSKMNLVYLEVPMELRFRFNNAWKLGIGFKASMEMDSKLKYLGRLVENGPSVKMKEKDINQLEKYTFGPTLRFGYKWISVFGFYQISSVFEPDLGPKLAPVSVGITLSPF
jgi:hypothetical protein